MRVFIALGALNMLAAVALGAFGAHGLRALLPPDRLAIYHTGVEYHLIHALGLLAVAGLWPQLAAPRLAVWSGWLLQAGIVMFCTSLYLLAVSGVAWLGGITPLGGLCFLAGWALLAAAAAKRSAV